MPSEGHDHFGTDRGDLTLKKVVTGANLVWQWIAIVGWPTLDDIRNEHARTGEADRFEKLVQKLTGLANERAALLVFVVTGSLANEQDVGMRRPFAWNGLRPGTRQRAGGTTRDLTRNLGETLFN